MTKLQSSQLPLIVCLALCFALSCAMSGGDGGEPEPSPASSELEQLDDPGHDADILAPARCAAAAAQQLTLCTAANPVSEIGTAACRNAYASRLAACPAPRPGCDGICNQVWDLHYCPHDGCILLI